MVLSAVSESCSRVNSGSSSSNSYCMHSDSFRLKYSRKPSVITFIPMLPPAC
jgi:hypothetical protein